jgi:hypothetical protein
MTEKAADRRNRLTPSYSFGTVAITLFVSASQELDMALNLWVLLVPVLLLPIALFLVGLAAALSIHLVWRRWRRVASILVGPPIASVCTLMLLQAGYDVTWMRFEATKSRYVHELEQNASPSYKVWQWGETGGVGTANAFYTLVYDESDAVAKKEGPGAGDKDSPSVLSDAVVENSGMPWVSVRHIEGHFYLVCELYN